MHHTYRFCPCVLRRQWHGSAQPAWVTGKGTTGRGTGWNIMYLGLIHTHAWVYRYTCVCSAPIPSLGAYFAPKPVPLSSLCVHPQVRSLSPHVASPLPPRHHYASALCRHTHNVCTMPLRPAYAHMLCRHAQGIRVTPPHPTYAPVLCQHVHNLCTTRAQCSHDAPMRHLCPCTAPIHAQCPHDATTPCLCPRALLIRMQCPCAQTTAPCHDA